MFTSILHQLKKVPVIYVGIFLTTAAIFSLLIRYGGFHHADDFHFIREYSWSELFQVWYSNWDIDNMESDGYRPLAIWIYSLLYTLFGFNAAAPWPYMATIVVINGIYSVVAFRLARHFLSKWFAFFVAVFSIILPQTLLHFTWATEIPATVCFILTLIAFELLIRWIEKPQKTVVLIKVIILGVIASLIKETGYSVLAAASFVSFVHLIQLIPQKRKDLFSKKYIPYVLPPAVLLILIYIRHKALLVFPEKLDPRSPTVDFEPTIDALLILLTNLLIELNVFFSYFFTLISDILHIRLALLPNAIAPGFFSISLILLISGFIINRVIWKKRLVSFIIGFHSGALIFYYMLVNVFIFSLLFQYVYSYKLIVWGFTAYQFTTYIILSFVLYFLFTRMPRRYLFLIVFFVITMIPVVFGPFNRIKPVPHVLLLILITSIVQFFMHSKQRILHQMGQGFALLGLCITLIYVVNVSKFILTDNYELSHGLAAKDQYEQNRPTVAAEVFDPDFPAVVGPLDCSIDAPGKAAFHLERVPEDGGSLILSSSNHIACINFSVSNFRPRTNYQMTFYANTVEGTARPDIYFHPIAEAATRKHVVKTHDDSDYVTVTFIPLDSTVHFTLYTSAFDEKLNTIVYKDFYFKGGGFLSYLQHEYQWPDIFMSEALQSPLN